MDRSVPYDKPQMEEIDALHANLCSGVADRNRIALLYELSTGAKSVTDLVHALGMPQSSASRHLRILRDRQLVAAHRRGTMVYYELTDPRVIEALDLLRAILRSRLESRAQLAEALQVRVPAQTVRGGRPESRGASRASNKE